MRWIPLARIAPWRGIAATLGLIGLGVTSVWWPTSQDPAVASHEVFPRRAQVAVLGTYHMGNPGQDLMNLVVDDVRSDHRQAELQEMVELLSDFEPTRIVVEMDPSRQDELDRTYQQYLDHEHELAADEREQIGFRLAAELGHEGLFAVDHRQDLAMGAVLQHADEHGPAFLGEYMKWFQETQFPQMQTWVDECTVTEVHRRMNARQTLEVGQEIYLLFAQVDPENGLGAGVTGDWFERNLRIFANLAALIRDADERVLVIYGAGHAPLLRQFIREAPNLDLVEVTEFLE